MKNVLPILIFLIGFFISCVPERNSSEILLKTSGYADSTKIYLVDTETITTIDSGYIVNNKLLFNLDVAEPTRLLIRPVFKSRDNFQVRNIWKENRQLTITAEQGNLKNAIVEGSVMQVQADLVKVAKDKLTMLSDSLFSIYRSLEDKTTAKALALRSRGRKISEEITNVDINYITDNPDNNFSAITLKRLMTYTIPIEDTEALYETLSDRVKSTKYGISIQKYLELSRDLKAGDEAVNFTMPDRKGNLLGLNDFKGKYVLLDFWSSGCGPCRLESPNLLRNYKEYRDKGFEIISISFDRDREAWEKALDKDGVIWTSLCDFKGGDGDVIMTYKVYFMPTYFLIGPDGIIRDKWQGMGQLDKKLKKLFEPA